MRSKYQLLRQQYFSLKISLISVARSLYFKIPYTEEIHGNVNSQKYSSPLSKTIEQDTSWEVNCLKSWINVEYFMWTEGLLPFLKGFLVWAHINPVHMFRL
jgi:hypothetical protein